MMTAKFKAKVSRLNDLIGKTIDGTASAEEKKELSILRDAVKKATAPVEPPTTRVTTMTLKEFREHVEAELSALEKTPDAKRTALVQRNIESVKAQGKTEDGDIVGVEVMIERTEKDRLAELERMVAEQAQVIEDLKERSTKAEDEEMPEETTEETPEEEMPEETPEEEMPEEGKSDKPVAAGMAMEAIDTLLSRMNALKEKIDSGNVTNADMNAAFDNEWPLKDAIRLATAIMAKAEEVAAVTETVVQAMQKLSEGETTDETDKAEDGPADTDEIGKDWCGDLAPKSKGGTADYKMGKNACMAQKTKDE